MILCVNIDINKIQNANVISIPYTEQTGLIFPAKNYDL